MTQSKHTPGPWVAEIDETRDYFQINTDMHAICTNSCCYEPFNPANARLIAAAPELLEALELRPKHCEYEDDNGGFDFDNYIKDVEQWAFKARAAIAKARGE